MTNKTFITGCDINTEWTIEWFLYNFKKHNPNQHIAIADWGMSDSTKAWAKDNFDYFIDFSYFEKEISNIGDYKKWFLKPYTMIKAYELGFDNRVWVDTDCEILGDITSIFNYIKPNVINIAIDRPWTKRRDEIWHNTGVFGLIGVPNIMYDWCASCKDVKEKYSVGNVPIGDQDVLHELLHKTPMAMITHTNQLPNKFNWLRIQFIDGEDSSQKLIVHWTGLEGKNIIKQKIKNG